MPLPHSGRHFEVVVNGSWPVLRAIVQQQLRATRLIDVSRPLCSDINTVQGKYPIGAPLAPGSDTLRIGGHEGVAEVVATGPAATTLAAGDVVVPLASGLGTWRTAGLFPEGSWHRVHAPISTAAAACLTINPLTALSMLDEFVQLQRGDCIVQTGANSAVGRCVIQLAAARGVRTVNIVRGRPALATLESDLVMLGADVVATPDDVRAAAKAAGLPPPRLALDCVGGDSSATLAKMLAAGGTLVTYGGMSLRPVTVPTPTLIFKDIRVRGFWCSGGSRAAQCVDTKRRMLSQLVASVAAGELRPRACVEVPLPQWQSAFSQKSDGDTRKQLLVMR